MVANNNAESNQPKDLTAFELDSYFDKYVNNCSTFLTPAAIECVLIAFSPAVAAYIQNVIGIKNVTEIQKAMQAALGEFRKANYHRSIFGSFDYLSNVDYRAILSPKSDVTRLLESLKARNRRNDGFVNELLNICEPVLKRYDLTFERLFPNEFENSKQEFEWVLPGSSNEGKQKKPKNPVGFGTVLTEKVKNLKDNLFLIVMLKLNYLKISC